MNSFCRCIRLLLWGIVCAVLCLACSGCGAHRDDGYEAFEAWSDKKGSFIASVGGAGDFAHKFALPKDDGKPLTPAEKKAFLSTGDFDKKLTSAQLADVLLHFKHLVHKERGTVKKCIAGARLYMPMMRAVMAENGLPAELVYLPFVESNYDVLVRSRSGALGLWQFIPSTASYYGLKRDLWTDERCDPVASTRTAAIYFKRLRDFFNGRWDFAVSAYNAGEGKIKRASDAVGAANFFELRSRNERISDKKLRMTQENSQYLPKFLAACKIMRNLELLGFEPLDRPPDMRRINIKPGTDLAELARRSGMEWDAFLMHNAYFLRKFSPPNRATTAVIPAARHAAVSEWVKNSRPSNAYAAWRPHTVKADDTVKKIASVYGATLRDLWSVNRFEGRTLRLGEVLLVPPPSPKPSGKFVNPQYKVKKGDTLWAIAKKHNITVDELLRLNHMTRKSAVLHTGDMLKVGRVAVSDQSKRQTIKQQSETKQKKIQPRVDSSSGSRSVSAPVVIGYHRVQPGDTLWSISKKYGITVDELNRFNGMSRQNSSIRVGSLVRVKAEEKKLPLTQKTKSTAAESAGNIVVGYHRASEIDTMWSIAKRYGLSVDALLKLNNMTPQSCIVKKGDLIRVKK